MGHRSVLDLIEQIAESVARAQYTARRTAQRHDDVMGEALGELEGHLHSRRKERPVGSYSAELFGNRERLLRKIMEESFEVCLELGRPAPDRARVAEEAADLVFHLLVGLVSVDVSIADVERVLRDRKR